MGTPYPRPQVGVQVIPSTAGRLRVTITPRDAACSPNNQINAIRFATLNNVSVDTGNLALQRSPFTQTYPPGTTQASFSVIRQAEGQAATLHVIVTDGCGEWPSFVGGAGQAF